MNRYALAGSLGLLFAAAAASQTSYPMITHATPVAVQRGKSVEVVVEGQMSFAGVHTFLVEGKGVAAAVLSSDAKVPSKGPVRSVRLKLTVDPDAALGVREFRLASNLAISTLGQILVVDDPVVIESASNNTPSAAQKVDFPCVIHGRIEAAEDVDCSGCGAGRGKPSPARSSAPVSRTRSTICRSTPIRC